MERQLKYSGNPIIGKVPEDWQLMRIKNIGYLYGGLTGKAGDDFDVDEDKDKFTFFIPFTNIFNNTYISRDNLAKVKVLDGENQNEVHKGDILFLMSSEDYDGIGKPAVIDFELDNLYLNSFCKGFRITADINSRFLNYLMSSHVERELVRLEAKGFIRINLRQEKLACCTIVVPKRKEQDCIADYLDEKCGEIDSLIALQEQMIEKLKVYKQSVITEAVTKGLDPDAKLVPSSIDWIGDIPKGWSKDKVIRCFKKVGSGTTPKSTDDNLFQGCINWLQSGDINGSDLFEASKHISEQTLADYSALSVYEAPFIIIAMYGASVGNISISHINACVNQACCVLSCSNLDFKYAFYALKSAKSYLIFRAEGGGQPNISQEKLKSLWIPRPPLDEQSSIASYLDEKCADIDHLIALKQQKIESLKEYKKSVIYEAVTGKTIIE